MYKFCINKGDIISYRFYLFFVFIFRGTLCQTHLPPIHLLPPASAPPPPPPTFWTAPPPLPSKVSHCSSVTRTRQPRRLFIAKGKFLRVLTLRVFFQPKKNISSHSRNLAPRIRRTIVFKVFKTKMSCFVLFSCS